MFTTQNLSFKSINLLISCLMILFSNTAFAQIKRPIVILKMEKPKVSGAITGTEVIKIPLNQPPLMHTDGGWEKGPSPWMASKKFPIEYRGGLLLLNRNGMVHYLVPEILFKEDGSIGVSANSMGNSFIRLHPFKRIYGKKGEKKSLSIITNEKEFGNEINIYLEDYKPYTKQQVN